MAGLVASGLKWTAEKLSSLLSSVTSAPSSSTSSDCTNEAMEDLKKLERTLRRIESVLMDAGERDAGDHSEKLRLKELKEVSYDVEDVVDDYEYDVLHAKIQASGLGGGAGQKRKRCEEVIDLNFISVDVPVSEEISGRVKEIRERFEEITREWEIFRLIETDGPRKRNFNVPRRPPTSSLVQESSVFGRDKDKENIIELLLSEDGWNRQQNLRVLSIVGMGGIGKTTLAQLVYNDERVHDSFGMKGWVWVSDDFDVVDLTRKIVTSFTKKNCDLNDLDLLQSTLKELVKEKSFFLVLDDVWNDEVSLWNSLHLPLTFAMSGTILVTARSKAVANIMQTRPPYILGYLDFKACWSFFKQLIFDSQERDVDKYLVQIGQDIAAKCRGLPLALKAVGSVLRNEYDVESWINIMQSREWESKSGNGEVLPALKLSYDHMPAYLKRCFSLFALFPKDHVFNIDSIVKLWMALGFIYSANRNMVEDTGRLYINELQERSMIQLTDDLGGFFMHDLLHDLAQLVAGTEVLRMEFENELAHSTVSKIRYLSANPAREDVLDLQKFQGSRILRLVQVVSPFFYKVHCNLFENLAHIRALDFSNTQIVTLPNSIGNLIQLRYLNLSNTRLEFVPCSICNLYNLQTLELTNCPILKLPEGIGQLINLRHLNYSTNHLSCLPYGIGLLTNLQSLPSFIVGKLKSEGDIGELKDLAYLTGALHIMGLENITTLENIPGAILRKKGLHQLVLEWADSNDDYCTRSNGILTELEERLLDSLEPHPNLAKLIVIGYGGLKFPHWVGDLAFSKLVEVQLTGFDCELLPPLGQLPFLKVLSLKGGYNICHIGREIFGGHEFFQRFWSLEKLEFNNMPKWMQWFDVESGDLPHLRTLEIFDCPNLMVLPSHLPSSLTEMIIAGCHQLAKIPTLPSLLYLQLCKKIHENLLFNSHLPRLKNIEISCSDEITSLQFKNFPLLEVLTVYNCRSIESMVGLEDLTSLTKLCVYICRNLVSLAGLNNLTSLKELTIGECNQLYIYPTEEFLSSLECYQIFGCGNID